jgi:hypothetical protein
MAEASGSRTHQRHQVPLNGFEARAQHRPKLASRAIVAEGGGVIGGSKAAGQVAPDEELAETGQQGCAPVAQVDRAAGFEPVGREFESLRARQILKDFRIRPPSKPLGW